LVTCELLIGDPVDQAPEAQRQPEAGASPAGGTTAARGRLVRRTDNKLIAGVASGIADALGIKPVLVRIAFVVLTAVGGLGLWLYVLGWLLLPPHHPRAVKLAVLWVVALLWAAGIAGNSPRRLFEDFVRRLWETRWAWPLAATVAVTVLAGAVLAFQQLTADRQQATATQDLTRQGQASERFTRAVDQLGSDRPEVRLGGIYGLEQIAQQAPDNRLAVTEVLVAYLHRTSPRPADPTPQPAESLRIRAPEVQAALTVLVRRRPLFNDPRLDLSELDLRGAEVSGQLVLVNNRFGLREGDLRGADLRDTDLRDARFFGVYLYEADFRDADLRGADFERVNPPGNDASDDSYPGQVPPLDLLDAGIYSADFRDALVDSSTKWLDRPPDGVRTL
jgi:phage shock protein PspC (stress-responsive transcriptional regulator)